MKICGIICEYNPFHNGHEYLIQKAKQESGCDLVLCIMSGGFTQRGSMAVLDKFTRAKHAVLGGADAVIELPAVFSVAPAELFAKGAVKLLSSVPSFQSLAFGCETADKDLLCSAAKATLSESSAFKNFLQNGLKLGKSFIQAKHSALKETASPQTYDLLRQPNNILAVEYTKALLQTGSKAEICPIPRTGANHADDCLRTSFSSASAIRLAVSGKKFRRLKKNVPNFVLPDLKKANSDAYYKRIALYSALQKPAEDLKKITDCSEGLENRIKALIKNTPDYDDFISKATTKRYISSRIRRILACSVLGITDEQTHRALRFPLYLKILAVNQERSEEILSCLSESAYPLLIRKNDSSKLTKTAAEIYAMDVFASEVYSLASLKSFNEYMTLFV